MSKKAKASKQLDLDFNPSGKASSEPKDPSAEHEGEHAESDEAAYGENPPLPYSASISASHGTDMVERDLAYRLQSSPEACGKHIEEGLHALASDPSESNRLSLRRRLRDVARAWGIPVSGRD